MIKVLQTIQDLSGAWNVHVTVDGLHRHRKYRGKCPSEATVIADVEADLIREAEQAVLDAAAEEQARIDGLRESLDAYEFQVVDKDGKPIVGATVKVRDAETDTPLDDVSTEAVTL